MAVPNYEALTLEAGKSNLYNLQCKARAAESIADVWDMIPTLAELVADYTASGTLYRSVHDQMIVEAFRRGGPTDARGRKRDIPQWVRNHLGAENQPSTRSPA